MGANTVAETTDMSLEQTADMIEDTQMSDSTKSFVSGQTSWSGSLTAHWDETDTNGQESLTIGASAVINFEPEGKATGDTYATGTALVSSVGVASTKNGIVSRTVSFQGTGALTWGTVS